MATIHVGCSGFSYKHWRGNFYPDSLPQSQWFRHYCRSFSSVELNVTFYRLPQAASFDSWREASPPGFTFAVKGSRFITHIKRLKDVDEALQRFFETASRLEDKLGVVLWQLPPGFAADAGRLARFLERLHDYPVRNTFEFRHESWINEETVTLCRTHNASICMADWPPFIADLTPTGDFIYIRRHGHGTYDGNYSQEDLERDAQRIRKYVGDGRDVFIYFNNDIGGFAPVNAADLKKLLQTERVEQ